jgi:hypothetical protein
MCEICRRNPCAPTCPNAEPDLYCAQCDEKIRKGSAYFSAIDYGHRRPFCSEDCLKQYFDIEEEEE